MQAQQIRVMTFNWWEASIETKGAKLLASGQSGKKDN